MLDNITDHLAKFEGYRTTIYADVKRIATTGIGNRVQQYFHARPRQDGVLQIDVFEKTDVIFHPTLLDFSSVHSLVSDRLETLRRP